VTQEKRVPFDRQHAATYDKEFERLAPFKDALHIMTRSALAGLGGEARILCVGAGTGAELVYLAEQFPGWHFTALDPSEAMLDVCRGRVDEKGLSNRCEYHIGPVSSLEARAPFDAATCLLVSQFLMDLEQRRALFGDIHARLVESAPLVTADLTGDLAGPQAAQALDVWRHVLAFADRTPEQIDNFIAVIGKMVSVLSETKVEDLIEASGFQRPLRIFQAGLMHGWVARA
jgi:tRNA (cmo5U34)-methyltransferase